ncbi:MAG: hypothetical protein C4291_00800 [Candidatus Dadabacteria bacterium]
MEYLKSLQNILKRKEQLLLIAILSVQFLVCLWLLDKRWINPDEGAHTMDGRLVLSGLIPEVDYGSRQVLYVYIIALFLKVFGVGYLGARILPLISTIGVSLLVFFISKRLFNQKVALLACGIYAFLPLAIVESTIVKTEPLTTLLSCTGMYLVISGTKSEKKASLFFFLSGVFISLAYYVRESSLAILVSIFLFFFINYWKRVRLLFKNYGIVLSGYICVCLIIFAYYSQFMNLSQIGHDSINPLHIVLESLQNISTSSLTQLEAPTHSLDFSVRSGSWNPTDYYLNLTLLTNSFLFVGFIFSLFILSYSLLTKRDNGEFKKLVLPFSLLYSWLFSLTLFYSYWTFNRGFFIQYFEEFLPPLSILLAFSIIYMVNKFELERNLGKAIVTMLLCLLIVFFFNRFSDFHIRSFIYFLITTFIMAFFYFSSYLRQRRWLYGLLAFGIIILIVLVNLLYTALHLIKFLPYLILSILVFLVAFIALLKRDFNRGLSFISFSLLLSSFILSFAISGRNMGIDFDNVWSPETVREASDYIKANSKENDEVISGAVIWELESDRKPFMNQTHPLGYESGIADDWRV